MLGRLSSCDGEISDGEEEVEVMGGGLEHHIWPPEFLHQPCSPCPQRKHRLLKNNFGGANRSIGEGNGRGGKRFGERR